MELTLKLFECLDFRYTNSLDYQIMDDIRETVEKIYKREILDQDSTLRKPLYTAISKLIQIPTLKDKISKLIESVLEEYTSFLIELEYKED